MLKKNLYVAVLVLSSLIMFNGVGLGQSYSPSPLPSSWEKCRRDACSWFREPALFPYVRHCTCYYAPALAEGEDKMEYSNKYEASKKVNLYSGYGGEIMLDGKRVENPFQNIKNFDFKQIYGNFWESEDSSNSARIFNSSFYGAVLKGSTFCGMDFLDCDFRYANLEDVDFGHCEFSKGVAENKFRGAIILGAILPASVTPEMILSTDSFTKNEYVGFSAPHGSDFKGEIPRHFYASIVSYVQNGQTQTRKCIVRKQQVVLDRCTFNGYYNKPDFSNWNFNKFNNGEKAPFPCSMQETVFHWSNLMNCKFTDGDLEKAKFINCNLQGSDFSGANLKMAEFCDSDISNCNFRNADIQGADFTGFYSRQRSMPIASISTLYKPYDGQKITKIEVEQLRTTKNFEDREFLDIKFGVSILRGLNLSRFNL
ncbi:MAG: pentapeptide repeat-containing protein, partial [Planctomycetaceae bacterium]|nr:pentapeptide repeat-containing protein [Planctomycetaceae bacterium]